ncbi:hypothetical protein BG004_007431, partial [Podila humilis]
MTFAIMTSSAIRMVSAPVQAVVRRQYSSVNEAKGTGSHSTKRLIGAAVLGAVVGSDATIAGYYTAADTEFYLGKRVAFVYRAKREVNGSKIRCIWGRITRSHGGSGAVKARFRNNLPAKSFGASVRV